MLRISTLTKALNLFGAGKHGFQDGDMATSTPPTDFDAKWCNGVQEEIMSVIEASGITPSNASYAQLLEAIKRMIDIQSGNYALDTGVANAYVITLDPAITAYTDGMTVRFRVVSGNTGASTLNAGAGAVPLVNDVAGALVNGDLPAGCIVSATYDGAAAKWLINSLVTSQALSQMAANLLYAKINTGKTVGEIFTHLGNTAPAGSLAVPVSATSISRAAYASLHTFCANLGYPWGAGDGATTFGMPYLAADYALLQSNANLRTTTGGQNLLHTHVQDAHSHIQAAHNHIQDAHNHAQFAHNHTQDAHGHAIGGSDSLTSGTVAIDRPNNLPASRYANTELTTATNQATTATNQATTATNQAATATNNPTTATNQANGGAANLAAGMRVLMCVQYL